MFWVFFLFIKCLMLARKKRKPIERGLTTNNAQHSIHSYFASYQPSRKIMGEEPSLEHVVRIFFFSDQVPLVLYLSFYTEASSSCTFKVSIMCHYKKTWSLFIRKSNTLACLCQRFESFS